jgi:alkylation response protein AidB-like acyl-CoA dehydrogenase
MRSDAEDGGAGLIGELRSWLEAQWDPEATVGAWWERLGLAGWAAPMLPRDRFGRGTSRSEAMRIAETIAAFGALGAPLGLGLMLAAPTIATHGTDDQVDRLLRPIVTGQAAWCQLFSEPGAGSDLASLSTRAERDGDVWVVNGQKVWTSGGQHADLGMLLARTNPHQPKHRGITWFALDMHQPGVEVRPLRQMTGGAAFNEVFLTDAVVSDANRIGAVDDGWAVANTTLHHERSGMGAGGGGARGAMARPGTVAGDLDRRVGDLTRWTQARGQRSEGAGPVVPLLDRLARRRGKAADPLVRQDLARSHTFAALRRMTTQRQQAAAAAGSEIPGVANFSKLLMADALRHDRDLGLGLLGARGALHAYGPGEGDLPGPVEDRMITGQALGAQGLPIYGGTDQIQRNVIGERVLGLPKEPGDLSHLPFDQLPRNG